MIDYEIAFKAITIAGILSGIFYRLAWQPFVKKQKDNIQTALAAQRNEFQAGYFDLTENRHDNFLKEYKEVLKMYVELSDKYNKLEKHVWKLNQESKN